MSVDTHSIPLREKIIGALIRESRLAAQKSIQDCAGFLGISESDFESYELGLKSISLPELEAISLYLKVPLERFWERETSPSNTGQAPKPDMRVLIPLRQRIIGAMLRQARIENGLSLSELADRIGIEVDVLESYELGTQPVPLPWLEVLSGVLNRSIREFQDQKGPVGNWNTQQRSLHEFLALPPELQDFVTRPINRPYLELAVRLSEMSVEKLRAVAEGLLEITY